MKVVENTPDLLIVEDTPWLTASLFAFFTILMSGIALFALPDGDLGVALFAVAVAAGLFLLLNLVIERTRVFFDGRRNRVSVRRQSAKDTRTMTYGLDHLAGSEVEALTIRGVKVHRVVLQFNGGPEAEPVPISKTYSNSSQHDIVSEIINAWLQARQSARDAQAAALHPPDARARSQASLDERPKMQETSSTPREGAAR